MTRSTMRRRGPLSPEHVITVQRRGGDEELRVDGVRAGDRDVRLVLPTREDD